MEKNIPQQKFNSTLPKAPSPPMVPATKSPPPVGLVGGTCDAYKATRRITPGSHRRVPGHLRCELRSGGGSWGVFEESNHDQPYLGAGFKHSFIFPTWIDWSKCYG